MRNDDRMAPQGLCSTYMVGVGMAVNDMGDWLVTYLGDSFRNIRGQSLRSIYNNDAAVINEEHRLNRVVSDHVETIIEILQPITLRWVDRCPLG